MKPRILLLAVLAVALIVAGLKLYFGRPQKSERLSQAIDLQPEHLPRQSEPTPVNTQKPPTEDEQRSAVAQLLTGVAEGMKKIGVPAMPPVAKQLRAAVETSDNGEIIRAFHEAIYGRWQKMREALPAIRSYLTHTNSFVRYTAARSLYTAGDRSGFETLLEMVNADQPITEGDQDLRVESAHILAKFREQTAAAAIIDLFEVSKDGRLLTSLATLGVRAPQASKFPFIASDLAITEYSKIGAIEFLPQIEETYKQSTDPRIKNAAAWALARSGNEDYATYLVRAAQPAINSNSGGSQKFDASTDALRYLGSVQLPVAKETLERALESSNPVAVKYAVVNLLYNQEKRSEKAKQVLLRELRGEQRQLETELLLNVASNLDDPEIRTAGEAFDQRSGDRSWKLYSVERKQWSIYNWIDDYTVVLNP
jgi:HEAT repeat protein